MDTKYIAGCLDSEGRLTGLPSKRKKKLCALSCLANKIPAGQVFTEREFTQLLNELHTFGDAATLRRELYDYFLIDRNPDGSGYRVNPDRLSAEELMEKYC